MSPSLMLTRERVIEQAAALPTFPKIINELLSTLDDPDANLHALTQLVRLEPVLSARILAQANMAANSRHSPPVRDIFSAISLIGLGVVRRIALYNTTKAYFQSSVPGPVSDMFWQHSQAVAICCEEVAQEIETPVSIDSAFIAGLLHDIGQLWLYHFEFETERAAWQQTLTEDIGIELAERARFGVDHSTVGAWLGEFWQLPAPIVEAVRHHHAPDGHLEDPMVAIIHVSEVLSNALDLTGRKENHVRSISAAACKRLGLTWEDEVQIMFGKIEARSQHINAFFKDMPGK